MPEIAMRPQSRPAPERTSHWLKRYYLVRFAFSAVWALVAIAVAKDLPVLAAVMLIGYPAWDAVANLVDARRSRGIEGNRAQLLNFVASVAAAIAVAIALTDGITGVLVVFGVWAGLAGILQLAAAVGRWKTTGAQWAMILSGAQSTLAGVFMIRAAHAGEPVGIATVAPYAGFGAAYFLVSAVALTIGDRRAAKAHDGVGAASR